MKTMSLKIPEDLEFRLAAAARSKKTTKSSLLRQAVESYLSQPPGIRLGSCLDLVKDLAGSLEGPGDLSYNKKRLKGYGR